MKKVCSKCGIEKLLDDFNKQKLGKNGRRANCRECQKKEHAEYRKSEHGKMVRNAWKKTEKGWECEQSIDNLITLCISCHIKQHNPVFVRWGYREVMPCQP